MLIVLVGPKGSGKSHIGRTLQAKMGVHFFHVEPHWVDYNARCADAGREPSIAEGIAQIHPLIARVLDQHQDVCIETTGASSEILDALLALRPRADVLVARIAAPVDLCLERVATRDPTDMLAMEPEMVRMVHELSEALELDADIVLRNESLSADEIVAAFAAARAGRSGAS